VFPAIIYVWFRRFHENPSKLSDTVVLNNSLFQHIVVTRTSPLQPLTCHVVDFLNARPYLGCESKRLIRNMACSESDEESVRNPNTV